MKIKSSAPGRAGIIGNPTDGYGGVVISCSIPYRAHIELEEDTALKFTVGESVLEVGSPSDLQVKGDLFDLFRVAIKYMGLADAPLHIKARTEIPIKSGFGGSSAMCVALLAALIQYKDGTIPHKYLLAEISRDLELRHLGVQGGYQDHYMASFGGLNYMDFRGKEYYRELDEEIYGTMENLSAIANLKHFAVFYGGVSRESGSIHKPIRQRWLEGDREVVEGYTRITQIAQEGKRALLDEDWERLGELMNENHAIQRSLGGSRDRDEELINLCLDNGAWGAKLAGAGGAGTIIALHPRPEELKPILEAAGAKPIPLDPYQDGVTVEVIP